MLDERLIHALKETERKLDDEGKLHSRAQLEGFYALFRERFGPERLRNLDGDELLSLMHDHGRRDGLVYWLEFKDDEEFPAIFGSIAGGSALKFGIYRRKETGAWMTGSPHNQRELSQSEAIRIAQRHRDQLLLGARLLERFPSDGSDSDYLRLQEQLEAAAPELGDLSWSHKYWSLLFPDKLDDYHNADYQRFHLMKLLQIPPGGEGRYVCAGRFVALAKELDVPMNTATRLLKSRNGSPHRYWCLGTLGGSGPTAHWPMMREGNCVAVEGRALGDLSEMTPDRDGLKRLGALLGSHGGLAPRQGTVSKQLFSFVVKVLEGDFVLATRGERVLGVGRVEGRYSYEPSSDFAHRHRVKWLSLDGFQLPEGIGADSQTLLREVDSSESIVAIEKHLLSSSAPASTPTPRPVPRSAQGGYPTPSLPGIHGRIQAVLERKGQVILYGPPGTGKTYLAEQTVRDLSAHAAFGAPFVALNAEQQDAITKGTEAEGPLVRMCCFHPSYGYEEFLEGYRPRDDGSGGPMRFVLRDGIFKRLCLDAQRRPHLRFYLIIDEINRGDIPRIMGELLTVMEKSKRGKPILLPMSGAPFQVPENVYLVGTMNTADRSIALLDTALRRRFGFLELMPDFTRLGNAMVEGIPLGPWLKALNARICEHVGRDGRNLQVGHAYLMERGEPLTDFHPFSRVVQEDLIPLLEEYCYEDWAALEKILGNGLVSRKEQRVRHELFDPARQPELIQALLAPSPEIGSSAPVIASEASARDLMEDEDGVGTEPDEP
ncbi:AAA family ATPase [Archangium violaceum]|uniref:AAA family ATPase n=1 Tax=Archangium violaceum TaxID=83451 RepID=UPI00193C4B1C|nr:AAA family ATPase [Archangium violaceum]QRK08231.1 AAA family ATPase [Archangium violaceum]